MQTFLQYLKNGRNELYIQESIIDNIIDSFSLKEFNQNNLPIDDSSNIKIYKPRIIKGIHSQPFREYMRSLGEVKEQLKEKLSTTNVSLDNILKLFAKYNLAIADNFTIKFPVEQIYKYREFDRTKETTDSKYWDDLANSINNEGIKEPGFLILNRLRTGNVSAILGEGNHRIAIAKKLKIKEMPLKFSYR